MQVTIYYFAYLRERRGLSKEVRALTAPLTVEELFQSVFGSEIRGIRFSINHEFVDRDQVLEDGDEVAFIPPVGGG